MRTLEITSYIGCPVRCEYCPQKLLISRYEGKKSMSFIDFQQILKNVPTDVRIDFSGFSEIFGNIEGAEMIRYAYRSGHQVVLYTTLVGYDPGMDNHYLRGVQFADLCFHQSPELDLANFNRLKGIFESEVSHGRTAEITEQWKWSRAGTVWDRPVIEGPFECLFAGKRFDHNVVLPNGEVYLCCQDYGLVHSLGNLYSAPFDALNREDYTLASNEVDSDMICRKCEIAQFTK